MGFNGATLKFNVPEDELVQELAQYESLYGCVVVGTTVTFENEQDGVMFMLKLPIYKWPKSS